MGIVPRYRCGPCGVFALDTDDATALLKMQLAAEIECPVRDISLPGGVEDVADLGMLADGKERFEIVTLEASALTAEAAQAALAEEEDARREVAEQRNKR